MLSSLDPTALVLGVVLQVLFTFALAAWGGWVARRRGDTRYWRFARLTPWLSFALLSVGVVVSIALLARAFDAIKTTDRRTRRPLSPRASPGR